MYDTCVVLLLAVSCKSAGMSLDVNDCKFLMTNLEPLRLNEIKGRPGSRLGFAGLLVAEISLIHRLLNMGEVYVCGCFLCPSAILG